MTGSEGSKHTGRMLASGTNIVGGVNPKGRPEVVDFAESSVPVFGTVADAMAETGADVSVISCHRRGEGSGDRGDRCRDPLAVVITEGIPVHDSAKFWAYAQGKSTRIIGPNCPGLISPGQSNAGIIPANISGPAGSGWSPSRAP